MPALAALVAAALAAALPAPRDPVEERFATAAGELARDARSPRAIVPLSELGSVEEDLPDLARLVPVYARVADDRAASPEIRGLARLRLARVERARGNLQRSAAHLRRLGAVTAWSVVGPFDDEGKRGLEVAYPPERNVDLEASVPGKVRDVAWRRLPPEAAVEGFVHLGAVVRPAREVVAYALAVVEAPRDLRVQLWLGASGASRVWVNGAVALSDAGYHPARLDQRGAAVTLRRGPNRILVKLCHADGRMGFYLRLVDERGDPAPVAAAAVPPLPPAPAARGAAPAPLTGVVARLEQRARAAGGRRGAAAAREEGVARRDLAIALAARQGTDARERRAEAESRRAAELDPASVETRLVAARFEEDASRRRAHLDAALAVDPAEPRALLAVAREELDRDRPHAAVRFLDRALAAAPAWPEAHVLRARALDRAGLEARAALAAGDAAHRYPTSPRAVDAAAAAARRLGRVDEGAWLLRKLLALRYDDGPGRAALAQLLVDRGDVAGAATLLREALRLDPSDVELRLRLADLLAANGRAEEAEEGYAAATRIAPDDADAWERRGRARLAAGRPDAVGDLQRALELRPQSPALKELVRSLEPDRERFETPYLLDARALARAAPAPAPGEDALVLADRKVTRVFRSGLSSTFTHEVTRIATQRAADALRRASVGYDPSRQEVRVVRARILRPDGTSVEGYEEGERSASEPWYRLYYETRVRGLAFPSLAPGDVLEVAWRVDDVAGENLLSDYFGDLTYVDESWPKASFDYVLLAPEDRTIHANDAPGVAHATRPLGGGVVEHRWTARDVPRVVPEPRMPGHSEVARWIHVSTYASWDEVARFYWDLVREQLRPNEEVRATAERIAAPVLAARAAARPFARTAARPAPASAGGRRWDPDTELALVRAVYDFVVTQTRYVGLEFGIHGYKPYRVDQVLSRRFGDCKDKASLVVALLSSLDVDARLVLLRMRRLGRMPAAPASLAIFNHAVVYVPRLDLWLDGTAAYSGSGDLPGEDRGATVLVLNPGAPPTFGYVPDARPADSRLETVFDVAVGADGAATVRGASRVRGAQAPGYRRAYETAHARREVLEQAFNRTFPGLEVRAVSVSDLARLEDEVEMTFELAVPRYAQPDGPGLRFTPFGAGHGYVEAYAPSSTRRWDVVLDPSETRFTYRYTLPPGWTAEPPERAAAEAPFGAFEVRYRADGPALVAEGFVTIRAPRVAPADYPAFRAFLSEVDRAFGRKVRIAPAAAPEAAR